MQCNLTELQSRPIRGKVWKYQFFVDVIIKPMDIPVALRQLEAQGCSTTLLGSYRAAGQIYED